MPEKLLVCEYNHNNPNAVFISYSGGRLTYPGGGKISNYRIVGLVSMYQRSVQGGIIPQRCPQKPKLFIS